MRAESPDLLIRTAGRIAIISGIISAIGVLFLIVMFALFAAQNTAVAFTIGMLNDICVALQYLLTIPIALALHRILRPHNAPLIRIATIEGIAAMLAVIILQLALVFGVVTFQQQVVWVTLAMIPGVGTWMVITGYVARTSGKLPQSVLMSWLGATYIGYPLWAFWLGRHL